MRRAQLRNWVRKYLPWAGTAYGFTANSLQIFGGTLPAWISAAVAAIVAMIGHFKEVNAFYIAASVPFVFLSMLAIFKLARSPVLWGAPATAATVLQTPTHTPDVAAQAPKPKLDWKKCGDALFDFASPALANEVQEKLKVWEFCKENVAQLQKERPSVETRDALSQIGLREEVLFKGYEELAKALKEQGAANEGWSNAQQALFTNLYELLEKGILIANGFLEESGETIDIPSDHWRFLKLDIRDDSAQGRGLEYHSIRIAKN